VTNSAVASSSSPNSKSVQPKTARRVDPMQASASYNGVASRAAPPQTSAMVPSDNRYDSG
jgi:hypothetical protein